ncbi:MAG: DUF4345 family protein [Bdellovibrionales bacterium]|nr:DUF4345 family protein [Bdellovibrionales bacterium]
MNKAERGPVAILCFLSVAYIAFGGWVALDPVGALSTMALAWGSEEGLFELTSNYAGINLAAGLFCLYAICRPALRSYAFLPPMILNGGYILGRFLSLVLVGAPGSFVIAAWVFEVVAFAVSLAGWRMQLSASKEDVV